MLRERCFSLFNVVATKWTIHQGALRPVCNNYTATAAVVHCQTALGALLVARTEPEWRGCRRSCYCNSPRCVLAGKVRPVRPLVLRFGFSRLLRHSSDVTVFSSCLTNNFGPAILPVIVVGSTTVCRMEEIVTSVSRWGKNFQKIFSFGNFCKFL